MPRHDLTRRDLLALGALALTVRIVTAAFIAQPGYMDVQYYAAGAIRLAQGSGLSEPFIWNYLDSPEGIPHPGFLYWMPLPSLLGAPFALLFPGSFFALQLPFALLSALLPPLTCAIAWEATGKRRVSLLAGLLAVFSGFFFPYWTLPETFTPCAVFGATALWLAARPIRQSGIAALGRRLLVGVLLGLAHLTRSDGLLLPAALAGAVLLCEIGRRLRGHAAHLQEAQEASPFGWRDLGLALLGYLLVMTPWFARNLAVAGAVLPPGPSRTLWLRSYDDLFCAGCDLSARSYLAWGWANILRSKLWAAAVNLERFLAEGCLVFLFPFALGGLYRLRRQPTFVLASIALLLIYIAHSLAFTFPGPRGGFFHASAALLPFLLAASSDGLDAAIGWAARRRRWNPAQARTVFGTVAVLLALTISVTATADRLPAWRATNAVYREIDSWLDGQGAADDTTVMIGNPPGFWYHTARPAVSVPNDDVDTVLTVARQYRVSFLVLDADRPVPLAALYEGEVADERLEPAARFGSVVVFRVHQ